MKIAMQLVVVVFIVAGAIAAFKCGRACPDPEVHDRNSFRNTEHKTN